MNGDGVGQSKNKEAVGATGNASGQVEFDRPINDLHGRYPLSRSSLDVPRKRYTSRTSLSKHSMRCSIRYVKESSPIRWQNDQAARLPCDARLPVGSRRLRLM